MGTSSNDLVNSTPANQWRQKLSESAPTLLAPGQVPIPIPEIPEEPKVGMKPPCTPDRLLVHGALERSRRAHLLDCS